MGAGRDEGAVDVVAGEAGLSVAWATYSVYESEIGLVKLCGLVLLLKFVD